MLDQCCHLQAELDPTQLTTRLPPRPRINLLIAWAFELEPCLVPSLVLNISDDCLVSNDDDANTNSNNNNDNGSNDANDKDAMAKKLSSFWMKLAPTCRLGDFWVGVSFEVGQVAHFTNKLEANMLQLVALTFWLICFQKLRVQIPVECWQFSFFFLLKNKSNKSPLLSGDEHNNQVIYTSIFSPDMTQATCIALGTSSVWTYLVGKNEMCSEAT